MRLGESWQRVIQASQYVRPTKKRGSQRSKVVSTRGRVRWDRDSRSNRYSTPNPIYVDRSKRSSTRQTPKPDGFDYESTKLSLPDGKRLLSREETYAPKLCITCGLQANRESIFCDACKPASKYTVRETYNH